MFHPSSLRSRPGMLCCGLMTAFASLSSCFNTICPWVVHLGPRLSLQILHLNSLRSWICSTNLKSAREKQPEDLLYKQGGHIKSLYYLLSLNSTTEQVGTKFPSNMPPENNFLLICFQVSGALMCSSWSWRFYRCVYMNPLPPGQTQGLVWQHE